MNYIDKLLNIRDFDYSNQIQNIVSEEKKKLLTHTGDLAGFCKYIANQIEVRLKELGIKTYLMDLYDIDIDHVFLICEYRYQDKMIRYLIDPTYIQFTKDIGKTLINLKEWPSEKINPKILKELLTNGLVQLNNDNFNNYLQSFNYPDKKLDLDTYLLNYRMSKISTK